ncbi:hypothetical protein F5877DRAFT_85791 [Lentinula edodes]|nr:hypothetical protein F5877DRAFT_85791 [Lentinula edodes]
MHILSTSTLLELNMLDERDTADADQHELQKFLTLQQGEAAIAARPTTRSFPSSVAVSVAPFELQPAPSTLQHKLLIPKPTLRPILTQVLQKATPASPLCVRLVVPPGRSVVASTSIPVPPCASPSFPNGAVAEAHSGLVQQAISPSSAQTPIKGTGQDLLSSNMPPTPCPTLVPCTFTTHPYHAENQHLAAHVWLLESQLADSQQENSSFTSALWDTSHAFES